MAALQKYRPVISLVQTACKQLDLPVPIQVYGSSDGHSILMGSVLNLAGVLINEAYNWQQLKKSFTCVGNGTIRSFDLPADFSRFTDGTGWSTAIRRPVVVLDDQQWAEIKRWLSASFYINPAARIINDQVEFMTPLVDGDTVIFQYQSANWVINADNNLLTQNEATKDGDIPMFDWVLMYLAVKLKWREEKGFDTSAAQSDFLDRIQQLTQSNKMAPILTLSGPQIGGFRYLNGRYNAPDTGYGS